MSDVIPAAPDDIQTQTYNARIVLWLENFATNFGKIKNGLNLQDIPKKTGEACICVAAGPSLAHHKHLSKIKKSGWKHPILCVDKKLRSCLEHGIIPYATATVDGSPIIANFYKNKIVRKLSKQINAAFSITVHPNVVKFWKGPIWWFTPMLDLPSKAKKLNKRSVSFILHVLSGYKGIASGIGNVGAFLWNLGYILESDPIILVGYDFSEQVHDKKNAVYFEYFTRMFLSKYAKGKKKVDEATLIKAMDKAADLHQIERNPDFNNTYLVNPIWKRYRETFAAHIRTSKKHTINASGGGCLHTEAIKCDNFESMSLDDVLRKWR